MSKFLFTHRGRTLFLLSLVLVSLCLKLFIPASFAANGINKQINFQGKVVNSNGTNVADGSYTFVFKLYTVSSSGTAIWTESKSITVNNGIFRTALGDTTPLPGNVDFNTDSLYLGINFNSDGEMTPRVQFAGVPYAFNADQVNGVTAASVSGQVTMKPILPGGLTVTSFGNGNGVTLTTSHGTSGNSGDISIQTGGTSSSGNSGNISIDTGAAAGTAGTITIAGTNATGLTLGRSGQGITLPGFASNNNSVLVTGAAGALTAITSTTAGQCFISNAAGNTPSWGSCGSGGANFWQVNSGVLSPGNQTLDFAFGATATASAKFALSLSGTNSTAIVNGTTSQAALSVINNGVGDLFTASNGATAKFVITNGGNVGIGTVTPATLLQVSGSSATELVAASLINTSGTANQLTTFQFGASGTGVPTGSIKSKLYSGGNDGDLSFWTRNTGASVQQMVLTNSGFLGLGSTSPASVLDVQGIAGANALARFVQNSSNAGADILTASQGASTKFVIRNDGNVGIGTSVPGAALAVGTTGQFNVTSAGAITGTSLNLGSGTITSGAINSLTISAGAVSGMTTLSMNNQLTNSFVGDALLLSGAGSNINFSGAGTAQIKTAVGQTLGLMSGGNVGIGTTTTTSFLHVRGISADNALVTFDVRNATSDIFAASASGVTKFVIKNDGTASSAAGFTLDGLGNIQSTKNQTLTIGGSSTGNISLQPRNGSGFVDITGTGGLKLTGTSAPITFANLETIDNATNGTLTFGRNDTGIVTITAKDNDANAQLVLAAGGTGVLTLGNGTNVQTEIYYGSGGVIYLKDGANATLHTFTSNGFTTQDIKNSTGGTINTISTGGSITQASAYIGTSIDLSTNMTVPNSSSGNQTGIALTLKDGGASAVATGISLAGTADYAIITAPAAGNVGIGSLTPTTVLDVQGIAGANALARFVQNSSNAGADILTASQGASTKFVIRNNGNVGIGSAIPATALDVVGTGTFSTGLTLGGGPITLGGVTGSGQCITGGATAAWGSCGSGGGSNFWQINSGVLSPGNQTLDLAFGGTATSGAKFALSLAGTNSTAIVNGTTSKSALNVINNGVGDLFTASAGASTKFVITNGGNVGIGTSIPTRAGLEVNTIAGLTYVAVGAGSHGVSLVGGGGDSTLGLNSYYSDAWRSLGTGYTSFIGQSASTGEMYFYLSNASSGAGDTNVQSSLSERMRITKDGWLGLGTSSPVGFMHISGGPGTNGANAALIVSQTGASSNDILSASAGATTRFTIANDGTIKGLNTSIYNCSGLGNSGKLTVDASGVVGCAADQGGAGGTGNNFWQINNGVLSPGNQTLDLAFGGTATSGAKIAWSLGGTNATQTITGSTSYAADVIIQNGVGDLLTASAGANTQFVVKNSGLTYIGGDKASNAEFSFTPSTATLTMGLDGSLTSGLTLYSSSAGNYGTISTDSSGNLNIATVGTGSVVLGKGSGNITLSLTGQDSDVFIADKTRSAGAAYSLSDFTFKRAITGAGNNLSGSVLYVTDISSVTSGLNTADLVQVNAAPTAGVFLGNLLRLQKNGNDMMVVDRNGYVGIGTTTPAAFLHLSGSTFGTGNALAIFNQTNSSGDILTASVSGVTKFVMTGGGNVGIGTTLPTSGFMLDVVGAGRFSTGITLASGQSYTGAGAVTVSSGGSGDLTFNSASNNVLIATGDQLGIGTTNPAGTIDVRSQNGTEPTASVSGSTSFAGLVVDNSGTGDLLTASSSGLNRFVIRQNGSVGIGTTLPTEKLQVVGGNIKIDAQTNAITALAKVSQTQPGKIASGASTELIASVSASAVFNGSLYVGTGKGANGAALGSAEVYRYSNTSGSWTVMNSTAGTLNTTASIASISAMTVFNGSLYVGTSKTNEAEVYRFDGVNTWTKVSQPVAGTIASGGTAAIDGISSMVVMGGKLYVGTREFGKAEVYQYGGNPGNWTRINNAAGKFTAATNFMDAVTSMSVYNNTLVAGFKKGTALGAVLKWNGGTATTSWVLMSTALGTVCAATTGEVSQLVVYNGKLYATTVNSSNQADMCRYDDGFGAVGTSWTRVINALATVQSGGTNAIPAIRSAIVYNGRLYIGTEKAANAELYQYIDGDIWIKINSAAGTLAVGGTTGIDTITTMIQYNSALYVGTSVIGAQPISTKGAEIYTYSNITDQSYALKFHASSLASGGEANGLNNDAAIWFMASPSAQLNTGVNNTGSFFFSHGLITGAGAYDVAEDYGIRDTSATPGDLISIDENETGFVRKAKGPYDTHIVGVYSENPGFRLSQADANINGAPTIPVALVGRVMVKVSTENGAIHSGDYLTSSSVPGVAMKATKSGAVVGKAMGEYTDQGVGKVLVYVTTSTTNGQSLDSLLPDGLKGRDLFGAQLLAELQSHISSTEGALSDIYADRIAAGIEIVTPKLTAAEVDASSLNITGNATISGTLTVDRLHVNNLDGLDILLSANTGSLTSSESALLTNLSTQVADMSKALNKLKNVDLLSTVSLDSTSSAITTVKDGFMVFGTTTLAEASVLNTLSVGTTLHISENSINTLGVPFEIQPMRQADISLMGGSIIISTDGTLHVNENAEFAKDVSVAGVLSATAIRGINDNLSVSGSATFDKIQFANPDIKVISNTEVSASASAGIVTLKANQNHIKINNDKVGSNSLLFITPKTNTKGKQLFIKEQKNGEYFTVGIDEVATFDIDFNFLIVN